MIMGLKLTVQKVCGLPGIIVLGSYKPIFVAAVFTDFASLAPCFRFTSCGDIEPAERVPGFIIYADCKGLVGVAFQLAGAVAGVTVTDNAGTVLEFARPAAFFAGNYFISHVYFLTFFDGRGSSAAPVVLLLCV